MSRGLAFLVALLSLSWLLVGCSGAVGPAGPLGPAGAPGPVGPVGPAGSDATASQAYVGADKCGQCHDEIFASFRLTGHANALTPIENGQAPAQPYDAVTGGIPQPPDGYSWDDVSYLIAGYGWKALFVDQDGYVITGADESAATQYNFANDDVGTPAEWVSYHAGESIQMTCGTCHTTGYAPQGHQDNREGIVGTWAFPGVQCEVCHGPGSLHAADPQGIQMSIVRDSQLCGDCHVRDNPATMDAADGFELHNIQYEDLYNSKHFALSCVTCHNPHASATYADETTNPNQGIQQTCTTCHWQNVTQKNRRHLGVDCIDCHMPPMAKSAAADLSLFTGDIRSHQFSINPDPNAPQFSEDGRFVMPYLTLAYACQQCHNGEIGSRQEPEALSAMARGYHDLPTPTPSPSPEPEPTVEPTATPSP